MKPSHVIAATLAALSMYGASTADAHPVRCDTVRECRAVATWNHSVVVDLNQRLAIANGRAAGGRDLPTCHTVASCRRIATQAATSRVWAQGAWHRLKHDNTPGGAQRIVRYRFHHCGPSAVSNAFAVVEGESGWDRDSENAAGDTSWWQIELPAHPDVSRWEARDAWEATGIAVRWSDCGEDFGPTWTAAVKLGIP